MSEDRCILYALHQGSDNPSRLAFVERWESREERKGSLAAHAGG